MASSSGSTSSGGAPSSDVSVGGGPTGSGGPTGPAGAPDATTPQSDAGSARDASVADSAVTDSASGSPGGGAGAAVHAWLTTTDLANRLTRQADVVPSGTGTATITFDDTSILQTMDGFGTAFTDTSCSLLFNKLSAANRAQVMQDLFSPTAGIGMSFMRVPMAATDYVSCAPCTYSYDDNGGAADPSLTNFSTARDDAYVIPVIKEAQAINPQMKLFASPWSPPPWMKTNASALGTNSGLRTDSYTPLAQYFVKFIQEYQSKGVALWAVTPQNEPDWAPTTYPGMLLPADAEATFIANDLVPALKTAGLSGIRIIGGDTVSAEQNYEQTLFANAAAASAIYGTGWHCYGAGTAAMPAIHADHPDKPLWLTECSSGPTGIGGNTSQAIMGSVANWAAGAVLWNIALDQNGGPKDNSCNGCTGLMTIDSSTGQYSYNINYYELGQYSKFVLPGAKAVKLTGGGGVTAAAFQNPDGSDVVVVNNAGNGAATFSVSWRRRGNFSYMLPAHGTVTFTDEASFRDP